MEKTVFLTDMTWPEVKARLPRVRLAILPTGSTEQHGPHLTFETDIAIATELARRPTAGSERIPRGRVECGTRRDGESSMSMNNQRPVTDEEIGMRTFQIRKARAVERAMERMRQGLKSEWSLLSLAEVEALGWVLGELWAYVARAEWEDLHFSKLKTEDIRTILGYAREIANHDRNSVDVLQDIYKVVVAIS